MPGKLGWNDNHLVVAAAFRGRNHRVRWRSPVPPWRTLLREFVDAYAVLGVNPTADDATIKAAYRQLAARHHPDLAAVDERAAANARMRALNIAYGLLAAPDRRLRYAAAVAALRVVVVSSAYPVVVDPVVTKFPSMPPGELRTSLLALARKDGVPVEDVLVIEPEGEFFRYLKDPAAQPSR